MFNAWQSVGVIGGAGALSYLAAGPSQSIDQKRTLRLSLDRSGSLITDVRLLGGVGSALGAWLVKNAKAKRLLKYTAVASFASLVSTEIVRMRLAQKNAQVFTQPLPLGPDLTKRKFGALPGPMGYHGDGASQRHPAGNWASR